MQSGDVTHALAGGLSWLECRPVNQKLVGSILVGAHMGNNRLMFLSHQCFSLSFFLCLSLKSINISLGEDLNKKRDVMHQKWLLLKKSLHSPSEAEREQCFQGQTETQKAAEPTRLIGPVSWHSLTCEPYHKPNASSGVLCLHPSKGRPLAPQRQIHCRGAPELNVNANLHKLGQKYRSMNRKDGLSSKAIENLQRKRLINLKY